VPHLRSFHEKVARRQVKSKSSETVRFNIAYSLSHATDITLLPSAFLCGLLKSPMHFGVR